MRPKPRFRCLQESCDPEGGPLFPVNPPWMHSKSPDSQTALDPLVLLVAWNYVKRLAGQSSSTTSTTTNSNARDVLAQKLFQDWCRNGLYSGPRCAGEPHGIVVGCAVVEAGRIVSIDPWGGRRWILHFPLLTHWTGLAGVAPLDYLASKLFEFICCIGSLPTNSVANSAASDLRPPSLDTGVALGNSRLVFQTREQLGAELASRKPTDRPLGLVEFLSRAASVANQSSATPLGDRVEVLSTAALPNVFLVVPAQE